MRKLAISAAFLVLSVSFVLAPYAGAAKPTRLFLPASDFTLTGICEFDVGVTILANNEYTITYSTGVTRVTGTLKVRLTNLSHASKPSIDLNISGPGTFTFGSNGSVTIDASGPWLLFFPGILWYVKGHSTFTATAGGSLIGFSFQAGSRTDICAVLDR